MNKNPSLLSRPNIIPVNTGYRPISTDVRTKQSTMGGNSYLKYVKKYQMEHPELSWKQCVKKASKSYKLPSSKAGIYAGKQKMIKAGSFLDDIPIVGDIAHIFGLGKVKSKKDMKKMLRREHKMLREIKRGKGISAGTREHVRMRLKRLERL